MTSVLQLPVRTHRHGKQLGAAPRTFRPKLFARHQVELNRGLHLDRRPLLNHLSFAAWLQEESIGRRKKAEANNNVGTKARSNENVNLADVLI